MKIFTISAYYPPYSYGGYENRVRDVMDGLSARGHQVYVLTTQPDKAMQVEPIAFDYPVIRKLHGNRRVLGWADRLTMKKSTNRLGVAIVFLRQIWRDMRDLKFFNKAINAFEPDLIYLGNVLPLSRSIFPFLADLQIPLVLDDGGKTMELIHENHGLWYRFTEESKSKPVLTRLMAQLFILIVSIISSRRLEKEWSWPGDISFFINNLSGHKNFLSTGIPYKTSRIIHSGLDLEKFLYKPRSGISGPLRVLVPGRIEPTKGQLDAVRLSSLLKREGLEHFLTIVGDNWKPEYLESLKNEVAQLDLTDHVKFLPNQDRDALIKLYQEADICFFPSYNKTGFSRIPLEAMACGCALITYGGESSDEYIVSKVNGYLIEPGDLEATRDVVCSLAKDSNLLKQIAMSARGFVEKHHSMIAYIDQIETFLNESMDQEGAM